MTREKMVFADCELDVPNRLVSHAGKTARLSPSECIVAEMLFRAERRPVAYEAQIEALYSARNRDECENAEGSRLVFLYGVRNALAQIDAPIEIATIWGLANHLKPKCEASAPPRRRKKAAELALGERASALERRVELLERELQDLRRCLVGADEREMVA